MKKLIYKSLFLILSVFTIVGCGTNKSDNDGHGHEHNEDAEQETHNDKVTLSNSQFEALQMKVDTLHNRNMSGYVEANGTLEVPPQNEASVTAVIGANVTDIEVIEGDEVKKGQVIAYLAHPNIINIQTDYLNAFSDGEFLKKDYERQKKLYDAGVGSGMNYQKAEAAYLASKARINGLEAQLKILNINAAAVRNGNIQQKVGLRSPIEGFIQKVEVKTGQYVAPQTELFEVVNTHHVHADLMVFEKDVQKVKKGQKVRFQVQSLPDEELSAEIYSVGKTFEESPKAVHIHAEIENKKGHLIPGMYIQGRVEIDNNRVIAIPTSGIVKDGDTFYAFTAEKEENGWSFAPVKLIKTGEDLKWSAVNFIDSIPPGSRFAFNNAYYLLAEMKKGEAEHSH
ncbi:efflux RND transporter periplasmic adaptor subunit [Zhouia amylolytica]|uniref:efflux RND transporter periplasmic adaptor subunit n=1 Tax=Zhouia amylolytica TaxID=376730 RepID=UPI0020CFC518|nr:efflux RND transporter periplasmic adaptor subunit [Zhouia amylolytica]MCQ0112091.1 efflux RND transporter periplasmic adaptor subunit [Zhouia amylolytica]